MTRTEPEWYCHPCDRMHPPGDCPKGREEAEIVVGGWRWGWLPGMELVHPVHGRAIVVEVVQGFVMLTYPKGDEDNDGAYDREALEEGDGYVLDREAPATLGCLLALTRKAWGRPEAAVHKSVNGYWVVTLWGDMLIGKGATEGEALEAALEVTDGQ